MEWTDPVTWIVLTLVLTLTGGIGGRSIYKRVSSRPPPHPRRRREVPPSLEPEPWSESVPSLPPLDDFRGQASNRRDDDTPTDPPGSEPKYSRRSSRSKRRQRHDT